MFLSVKLTERSDMKPKLLLISNFLLIFVVSVSCSRTLQWSKAYSVSGSLSLPYAEIKEPFDAWYDEDDQKSRIDYYHGTVKTYQLGNYLLYGSSFQVVPVTTETETNKLTCFPTYGAELSPVVTQSLLPDITNFTFIGMERMNGYQCDVWRYIEKDFERISTYTIYIRWQRNARSPALSVAIPVRYEMKGFNTLIGSHYDHYYLDYDNFTIGKPSSEVFHVSSDVDCSNSDDLTDHHVYSWNPMKEYIDRHAGHTDLAWDKFRQAHDKSYDNDEEHKQRKEIFKHNLRYIHSTNRKGLGYTLKVNHLADQSPTELRRMRGRQYKPGYNGGDPFPYTDLELRKTADQLPKNFDWRILGAVTPVKDQATCGSCWSFGSSGSIEGAYFIKTGKLVSLSQQALVDCSWGFGNNGCNGGLDFQVYQWMLKHGGIPSDEDYGYYKGQDGYCHLETVTLISPITGYVNVTSGDENALKVALFKHGPISVSIDASHKSFSFYSNGVYYEKDCNNKPDGLDHSVLAVGYGTLNGEDYWLIKNSWSNHWGDQGYVLMSAKDNNCGVMTEPTYVTM